MAKWQTSELGTARGLCASCGQVAELRLTQSAYRRTWRDALSEQVDDRVDRRVHCGSCRAVYPVRSTDPFPPVMAERRRSPGSAPGAGAPYRRRATDRREPPRGSGG